MESLYADGTDYVFSCGLLNPAGKERRHAPRSRTAVAKRSRAAEDTFAGADSRAAA
jgi:hypothetical protein